MPDRTQVILALVELILRERVPADRLRLALRVAIDPTAVAAIWPPTGHDEAAARWVAAVLLGEEPRDARDGTDCLVVATAVSRRLADVAVSLRVHGDAWSDEALALWDAASRLSGFEATLHRVAQTFVDEINLLTRARDEEVARLTEQLATARADLEEALRSTASACPPTTRSTKRECRHREDGDASACDHCSLMGLVLR